MASPRAPGFLGTAGSSFSVRYVHVSVTVSRVRKYIYTHSLCLLQAPARSLSARKCRPSPLSLTVWTRIFFYIQIVVFRGPPAVDEFRRAGMCKAAGSGVDILQDRANVASIYRGRSRHRQPRQEWKAVGCSPEGLHAPDDGPSLPGLRYDFPVSCSLKVWHTFLNNHHRWSHCWQHGPASPLHQRV